MTTMEAITATSTSYVSGSYLIVNGNLAQEMITAPSKVTSDWCTYPNTDVTIVNPVISDITYYVGQTTYN